MSRGVGPAAAFPPLVREGGELRLGDENFSRT